MPPNPPMIPLAKVAKSGFRVISTQNRAFFLMRLYILAAKEDFPMPPNPNMPMTLDFFSLSHPTILLNSSFLPTQFSTCIGVVFKLMGDSSISF